MNLWVALVLLGLIATSFTTGNPGKSSLEGGYGAVTCGQEICSKVGRDILRAGGNAADAVCTFTLTVRPVATDRCS